MTDVDWGWLLSIGAKLVTILKSILGLMAPGRRRRQRVYYRRLRIGRWYGFPGLSRTFYSAGCDSVWH